MVNGEFIGEASAATVKRYPAYKDSGVEWLGEIPEHWEIIRLKNFSSLKARIGFHGLNSNHFINKGAYCITGTDFENGKINFENCYKVSDYWYELDKNIQIQEGDVLVTKDGTIGKLAIVDKLNNKATLNSGVFVLRPKINAKMFYWQLSSHLFRIQIDLISRGSTINHLYERDFRNFRFLLPSSEEQTAIANFLDEKTAKIDKAIAQKEKLIALLKERKQIMIQAMVSGKWLIVNDGSRQILAKPNQDGVYEAEDKVVVMVNGQLSMVNKAQLTINNSPLTIKDSGVEWIGDIPEHWDIVPIRRMIDVRDGTHDTPQYIDENENSHFLITSKDFDGDNINFDNAKSISKKDFLEISKRSGVSEGDVIMSMIGGNIGKSIIANSFTDYAIKNVALFRTEGNIVLSKFLRYYLQSGLLNYQIEITSRGGAQGFLSLGDLRNLVFFKMPENEHARIVHFIDIQVSRIEKAIKAQLLLIEKLKEYKATLINSVVTGKIKVC